jgi:hypothetical protein
MLGGGGADPVNPRYAAGLEVGEGSFEALGLTQLGGRRAVLLGLIFLGVEDVLELLGVTFDADSVASPASAVSPDALAASALRQASSSNLASSSAR